MQQYLTRKNIGWAMTIVLAVLLIFSSFGKFSGAIITAMNAQHIQDWIMIIGIGELISAILFVIPKTMRLGTVLLSAYFGGAIMFHMAHPDIAHQGFLGGTLYLIAIWTTAWVRGMDLIGD